MYINTDITDITVYLHGKCFIFVNYKTIIPFARYMATSFPGSSLLWRRDPGRSWSRGSQILDAKLKLYLGRVVEECAYRAWKIRTCVL